MGSLGATPPRSGGHARTSSSDGQRYLFPRKTLKATYSHRLGDYALEFYTFVADNYAPFYSTPIECTERDAAYVLDGLLYHESEIDPEEHYTDTHGYTELNFAAFAMFGKRFCPRIRGLHRQWIYRIDPDKDYGPLDPVVNRKERTIHLDWITEHWDRIGQFFAAFASGQTTASVALKRLVGHGPKNRFYRATRELGRVFKTEFILDYLSQPALRTRIRRGAPQGRTATRPRPVRPLRPTGPTGSARLRTPNRRGELPASHPRSYHLLADSGDRSCFERGGLGCGRSQLRVTVPYQPDRVGQRPPLRRVPAQPQSRAKRKA